MRACGPNHRRHRTFQVPCAKLGEADDSEGAWRKLPIRVRARLKGYETLEFEYRPGDTLPLRTL